MSPVGQSRRAGARRPVRLTPDSVNAYASRPAFVILMRAGSIVFRPTFTICPRSARLQSLGLEHSGGGPRGQEPDHSTCCLAHLAGGHEMKLYRVSMPVLPGRAEMNAAARHIAIAIAKTKGTAKKYFQTRMAFTTKEANNAAMSGRT